MVWGLELKESYADEHLRLWWTLEMEKSSNQWHSAKEVNPTPPLPGVWNSAAKLSWSYDPSPSKWRLWNKIPRIHPEQARKETGKGSSWNVERILVKIHVLQNVGWFLNSGHHMRRSGGYLNVHERGLVEEIGGGAVVGWWASVWQSPSDWLIVSLQSSITDTNPSPLRDWMRIWNCKHHIHRYKLVVDTMSWVQVMVLGSAACKYQRRE